MQYTLQVWALWIDCDNVIENDVVLFERFASFNHSLWCTEACACYSGVAFWHLPETRVCPVLFVMRWLSVLAMLWSMHSQRKWALLQSSCRWFGRERSLRLDHMSAVIRGNRSRVVSRRRCGLALLDNLGFWSRYFHMLTKIHITLHAGVIPELQEILCIERHMGFFRGRIDLAHILPTCKCSIQAPSIENMKAPQAVDNLFHEQIKEFPISRLSVV